MVEKDKCPYSNRRRTIVWKKQLGEIAGTRVKAERTWLIDGGDKKISPVTYGTRKVINDFDFLLLLNYTQWQLWKDLWLFYFHTFEKKKKQSERDNHSQTRFNYSSHKIIIQNGGESSLKNWPSNTFRLFLFSKPTKKNESEEIENLSLLLNSVGLNSVGKDSVTLLQSKDESVKIRRPPLVHQRVRFSRSCTLHYHRQARRKVHDSALTILLNAKRMIYAPKNGYIDFEWRGKCASC